MKLNIITTLTLTAAFVAATAMAAAQDQPQPQPNTTNSPRAAQGTRKSTMQKFLADLDKAVSRANLSDQQRRDLDNIRASMQKQKDARKQGATVDRKAMRQNMQALRNLISSEAFLAEDRETLLNDLQQMRGGAKRRGTSRQTSPPPAN
jgi:hypothetical protein